MLAHKRIDGMLLILRNSAADYGDMCSVACTLTAADVKSILVSQHDGLSTPVLIMTLHEAGELGHLH